MSQYDIIFITETHCNGNVLPTVNGFSVISDPSFPTLTSHGGIAAYVKTRIFEYVTNIRYTKISLSFMLSCLPRFSFMAVYMYPVDSVNYALVDFGTLSEEIEYWLNKGAAPFIAGDFNSRLGSLKDLADTSLKWRYDENIDPKMNSHGKLLATVCKHTKTLPLNHCRYYNNTWDGKFTYYKAGKQSQIDFCLTNSEGRKHVSSFEIQDTNWHNSDHLPLKLSLKLPKVINANMLLLRTKQLFEDHTSTQRIPTFKFKFNTEASSIQLESCLDEMYANMNGNRTDDLLKSFEDNLQTVLKSNRVNVKREERECDDVINVSECNRFYEELQNTRKNHPNDTVQVDEAFDKYQVARKKFVADTCKSHEKRYKKLLETNDDRKLWHEINWAGKYNKSDETLIHIDTMADYFENLYEPLDHNEKTEFNELHTDVYMPITDDPITNEEIGEAGRKTSKGGYDYPLPVLKLLMGVLLPLLTIMFNMFFYVSYPIKLALSILCAIPKKGNRMLPTNYRGIQLQPLLATLYDRVLNNRLHQWAKFSPEQSAFQKGKGTLDQIFLLRTIISLAKHSKTSLFIGFFDLAKAFDKVSRTLLLKSLIRMGIGASMFYAIKSMYTVTKCTLKSGKKLSDVFYTHTGIKQGAPSSVTLFLLFMDEFIAHLRTKCIEEKIIGSLHVLLHADDTVVISTNRELFVKKCNTLISAFTVKKLTLNISKSGFMVINPLVQLDRVNIKLDDGWLSYVSEFVYLGVIFSDNGTLNIDVDLHADSKRKSVFKLAYNIKNKT